jgi:competence protein ComEC
MTSSRSLGHRAPLLWLAAPFLAGLVGAKACGFAFHGWFLAAALAGAVVAVHAAWRGRSHWSAAIVVAMTLAGSASYALHQGRLRGWEELPPREVRLTLQIDRVFSTDPRKAAGLATVCGAEDHLRALQGQRVYFAVTARRGEPPPIRTAIVRAVGVLASLPENPPANSFDGYLVSSGMNYRLTRGRLLSEEKPASAYARFCAHAAARCKALLGVGIEEKRPALAGLLRAMMLGETHELSEEQHTLFMQSGTMHLFAISGLNIGVISEALQALLLLGRLPAWLRYIIGTALLWLFVDITGAAPSAVRAFVMSAFLHGAFVFRRPANPLAAVVASMFAVLVFAPLQAFGASFLMSYAIVVALLVLGLPLSEKWLEAWTPWRDIPPVTWSWWQRRVADAWRGGVSAIAIGLASSLVGLLTGLQFFGLLTPGSLLANLVLIPAAMIVTVAGFGALVCGLAHFMAGAALCNHAAALVLAVIERLVSWSVKLPGAFIPAEYARPWVGPTALAVLMVTLIAGYAWAWRRERGGCWPPFVVVALVLLCGVNYGSGGAH